MKRLLYILLFLFSINARGQDDYYYPLLGNDNTGTFTFKSSTSGTPAVPTASTVTSGSINTTGSNFAVAIVTDLNGAPSPTVTDNKGNTWTLARSQNNGGSLRVAIYYSNMTSVGTGHTFTYTTSSQSFPSINIITFSTTSTVSVDQQNGASTTSSTTIQPGSITPAQNNELIITGCVGASGTSSITINSGFTVTTTQAFSSNINFSGGAAYLIQTTASAVNPTWTFPSSQANSVSLQVSFKQ